MGDKTYQAFVAHWKETTDLPPQTVGPLTPLYKRGIRYVKSMPVSVIIMVSIAFVCFLFLLLGSAVPTLVTMLQRGF